MKWCSCTPTASASMTDCELRMASNPARPETLAVTKDHVLGRRVGCRRLGLLGCVILHGLQETGVEGPTDLDLLGLSFVGTVVVVGLLVAHGVVAATDGDALGPEEA
eukprot:1331519-Pyramimonas_sp.AAC.1